MSQRIIKPFPVIIIPKFKVAKYYKDVLNIYTDKGQRRRRTMINTIPEWQIKHTRLERQLICPEKPKNGEQTHTTFFQDCRRPWCNQEGKMATAKPSEWQAIRKHVEPEEKRQQAKASEQTFQMTEGKEQNKRRDFCTSRKLSNKTLENVRMSPWIGFVSACTSGTHGTSCVHKTYRCSKSIRDWIFLCLN